MSAVLLGAKIGGVYDAQRAKAAAAYIWRPIYKVRLSCNTTLTRGLSGVVELTVRHSR
ncbi:protein of unknown function [Magnetospirillum sp. XM-1]|nr:protein of unknown function [Magnetospirillum sp. XM-1]